MMDEYWTTMDDQLHKGIMELTLTMEHGTSMQSSKGFFKILRPDCISDYEIERPLRIPRRSSYESHSNLEAIRTAKRICTDEESYRGASPSAWNIQHQVGYA